MTIFKTIFVTACICLIALALGTVTAVYVLNHFTGFDRLTIGQWQGSPLYGSAEADPFARAQRSRAGFLPLGTAEGQRFTLIHDESGKKLDPHCSYQLQGKTPPARFWTLHASDLQDKPFFQKAGLPQKLHSQQIWYQQDGQFDIKIASKAQAGNWLAINTASPFQLVLTLYDTNLGSSIGFEEPQMPVLQQIACARVP